MRIAKKRIELGDMTFCLGIDRNISAEVFEKYPLVIACSKTEKSKGTNDIKVPQTLFIFVFL